MEATQEAPKSSAQQESSAQTAPPEAKPETKPEPNQDPLSRLLESAIDETARREAQKLVLESERLKLNGRIALSMYNAGLYQELKGCSAQEGAARASVKINLGATMGIEPYEAMQSIFFVHGRPDIASAATAARLRRFNYDWDILVHDDRVCSILLKKYGEYLLKAKADKDGKPIYRVIDLPGGKKKIEVEQEPVVLTWRIEQAQRAGLIKDDSGWKKYPDDMLFGKVIKRFQKRYAAEIFNGANLPEPDGAEDDVQIQPIPLEILKEGTYESAQDVLKAKLAELDQPREDSARDEPVAQETKVETSTGAPPADPKSEPAKSGASLFGEGLAAPRKKQ